MLSHFVYRCLLTQTCSYWRFHKKGFDALVNAIENKTLKINKRDGFYRGGCLKSVFWGDYNVYVYELWRV